MHLNSFYYELPDERVALRPALAQDRVRLMVVDRRAGTIAHRRAVDVPDYVDPPDRAFINQAQPVPTRLVGVREGNGGRIEVVLLRERKHNEWEVLIRCSEATRGTRNGSRYFFAGGRIQAVTLQDNANGRTCVRFETEAPLTKLLETAGAPPPPGLPPDWPLTDLSERKEAVGVEQVTLKSGLSSLRAIETEDIRLHRLQPVDYRIPREAARHYAETRAAGGRIVAFGGAVVRALETVVREQGRVAPCEGQTELFVCPPEAVQSVDALLTHFHPPRSAPLILASAFGGPDLIREAYETAVREQYRFHQYGDLMLIL